MSYRIKIADTENLADILKEEAMGLDISKHVDTRLVL